MSDVRRALHEASDRAFQGRIDTPRHQAVPRRRRQGRLDHRRRTEPVAGAFRSDFAWRGGSDTGRLLPAGNIRSGWRADVRLHRAMRALRLRHDADRLLEALLRRRARSGRPRPSHRCAAARRSRHRSIGGARGGGITRRSAPYSVRSEAGREAVSVLEEWAARKTGEA